MSDLALIEQRLANVERELAKLKSQPMRDQFANPLKRLKGMLADEPLFDEWQQAIEEYRRQRDAEEPSR